MTYDFRAQQVRLNRIISSGSIPILIYASSSATDLQGGKTFPDPGSDVFLFISGSSAAKTVFGGDVVISGSLTSSIVSASQITGSLQNITTGIPYLVGGTNITLATSSIGQITITSTAASSGGDVNASYVVLSATSSLANERILTAGNGIRLADGGAGSSITISEVIWTEQTSIFASTTSSIGIKTSIDHNGVDLFISGSDTTGNGANLVLYNDLSGFGLPRLILSSSSGSLGGLVGYDDDVNGLVDGINIDVPNGRNFGVRIGGNTTAATIDSAGNLNVRSGSASTGYFDVLNRIVGIGVTPPNLAGTYTDATRVVIKDTDNTGNKYQLFLSNEYPGTDLNSGIAFAFGPSNISGAIYAKSNTISHDRKGLNALIPTGNSFSWRTAGAHLGELTDSGNLIISGSVKAYTGFTGSLSGTIGGLPFIVGGPNITASYNSLGQWEITGSSGGGATVPGGLDKQIQFNSGSTFSGSSNLTYNYTTNTLTLTGSLTASTVVAGGVNITPIAASLVIGGDNTNRASGSISGLFESGSLMIPGTIGKFDVEILAMDFNLQTGASWKYTATALWPYSGNFSFLAATELAAEYGPTAGSYNPVAEWDVNFNSLGQIELTGSAAALPSGGTSFYVQVTKKMIARYGTIIA